MKSHVFRASSSSPAPDSFDGGLQDFQPHFTFIMMGLNKVLLPVNQHGKPRKRKPPPHPRTSDLPSPVTVQRVHPWARNLTVWTYTKAQACVAHSLRTEHCTESFVCIILLSPCLSPLGKTILFSHFCQGFPVRKWGGGGRVMMV